MLSPESLSKDLGALGITIAASCLIVGGGGSCDIGN